MAIVRYEGRAFLLPDNPDPGDTFVVSGRIWTWDGEKWVSTPVPPLPGGTDKQIQFNDGDLFGGAAELVWDKTNLRLGVNMATPLYALDVTGDANVTGTAPAPYYRINGIALANANANGTQINLTNIGLINGTAISDLGLPAGNDTEIQFNDNGAFGASANLVFSESPTLQYIGVGNGVWLMYQPAGGATLTADDPLLVRSFAANVSIEAQNTATAYVGIKPRLGVGAGFTPPITYELEVAGDVNIPDSTNIGYAYRINGIPLAALDTAGTGVSLTNITEINGTDISTGIGTPAGTNGQIQFNDSGAFGASADLTWDGQLTIADNMQTTNFGPRWILADASYAIYATGFVLQSYSLLDIIAATALRLLTPTYVAIVAPFLGIGTYAAAPSYKLEVQEGDVNITDPDADPPNGVYAGYAYRINGIPIAALDTAGTGVNLTNVTNINGTDISGGIGGTPAGTDGQIQFNDNGAFGASSNFVVDETLSYRPEFRIGGDFTFRYDDDSNESSIFSSYKLLLSSSYGGNCTLNIGGYSPGGYLKATPKLIVGLQEVLAPNFVFEAIGDINIINYDPSEVGAPPFTPLNYAYRINGTPFATWNNATSTINLTNINSINGTDISAGIGGTPAGANGQIQWNNNGAFGASTALAWNDANSQLLIASSPNDWPFLIQNAVTGGLCGMRLVDATSSDGLLINVDSNSHTGIITFNAAQGLTFGSNYALFSSGAGIDFQLQIVGDVNIVDLSGLGYAYRINGIPFAVRNTDGATVNLTNVSTINGAEPFVDPATTLGDLLVHDGTALVRLPVGTDGQVLVSNSAAANGLGVAWTSPAAVSVPVTSVFTRIGDIVAASGDYNATLITLSPVIGTWTTVQDALTYLSTLSFTADEIDLNPGVSTWTTVQDAVAGINSTLSVLSRGMAYIGAYDAAGDVATFVSAVGIASGPLPAADATGIHPGDYVVVTTASNTPAAVTGATTLVVGDQLISDGTSWNRLPIGFAMAAITADLVPMNPVIGTWTTVQGAITALSTMATPAGGNTQIQYNDNGAFGASANLTWNAASSTLSVADASANLGTLDPTYGLFLQTVSPAGYLRLMVASGMPQLNATSLALNSQDIFVVLTGAGGDERLRITAGGNLGVGDWSATDPAYQLDVQGDVNISTGSVYRINGVPLALPPALTGATAGEVLTVNAAGTGMEWAALPTPTTVGAAPTTPTEGQMWFDTASMSMYIQIQGAWVGI